MPPSKAHRAEVAARRAKLIRMRRDGIPFEDIVLHLGYASRQAASKDLVRALEQNRDEEAAEVSIYRQQENERLDALLAAFAPAALEGDPKAAEILLKISAQRCKLNGLNVPERTELTGAGGGPLALQKVDVDELENLISIGSRLDQENPPNTETSATGDNGQ